jgi:hypothetical protein
MVCGRPPEQRHHVAGEVCLQRRVLEQLVQHDIGIGIDFQFDDDAHAVAVGFIADLGNILDDFFAATSPRRSSNLPLFT